MAEWFDMQGLVVSGYPHFDAAAYVPLRIEIGQESLTRRWFQWIAGYVTTAAERVNDANIRAAVRRPFLVPLNVNVALSSSGLKKLGRFADRDRESFLYAFTEGIDGSDHRSRILGDVGPNKPKLWEWGGKTNPVDVLLMVFADKEAGLPQAVNTALAQSGMVPVLASGKQVLEALSLKIADGREHFGFVDGKSQPILTGTADAERYPDSIHLTELGEFVFGYPDDEKKCAGIPSLGGWDQFGKNGTYLIFRQLEQDVATFWDSMYRQTSSWIGADPDAAADALASKIVGRDLDGTPLVPYGNPDDNEFDFTDDPHGYGCPFGAHVRRANPRGSVSVDQIPVPQSNRHRLLRRSRLYGTKVERVNRRRADSKEPRGLLFLALNSDFERQFEFINQNWVNSSGFSGVQGERDPLVGRDDARRFTIPGLPARTYIDGLPRFVTVRGGEYFFLPGIKALKYLGGAA